MDQRHPSPHSPRLLLIAFAAAVLLSLVALVHGELQVSGQTAGPIATRPVPVIAGPQNGGVSVANSNSIGTSLQPITAAPQTGSTTANVPPSSAAANASGGATTAAPPGNLNLTQADGVNLIAGQSLLYVPPDSANCSAVAQLEYTQDESRFSATCASGTALNLAQPATLCMEPSPQILTSALGNLANLSVTSTQALPSRPTKSGVLVCADVTAPGAYTLSVSGKTPPVTALHALPKGVKVQLPAVGLGGLLP